MKFSIAPISLALFLIFTTQSGWSQLVSRGEALIKRYDDDRANGLIRLNENYIRQLREEMATATRAARLDEATALKAKVDTLEAENQELAKVLAAPAASATPEEISLIGKTLHFPHSRDSDAIVRLVFKEDGKVNWIGRDSVKVQWFYKQADNPLIYKAWMPGREESAFTATVEPDGSKAVVDYGGGIIVEAKIKRSDRDEAEAP